MDVEMGDTEEDIRLLVVEDNDKLRRALAAWLALAGCRVAQAPDGETALALLGHEAFDVVVADIVMGAVSGIDVLSAARHLEARPAVILLTGHGALESAMAAVRAGAHDYLLKPCDEDALLASVRAAATRAREERRMREAARGQAGLAPDTPPMSSTPSTSLDASPAFPAPSEGSRTDVPVPAAGEQAVIVIGALAVGPSRHEVRFRNLPMTLTRMEYALLRHLAAHPGRLQPYGEIVRATHELQLPASEARDLLHTHVTNLRRKLDPAYLLTDAGAGYMLVDPCDAPDHPDPREDP